MKVKVRFYEGEYRKKPPFGTTYRPHFVIKGTSEYLGVQFVNLDESPFEKEMLSNVKLLYEGVDYSALVTGTVFEIREGAHTVGEGIVISS